MVQHKHIVVIISADQEWRAILKHFPQCDLHPSPCGDWFIHSLEKTPQPLVFFHGGWGKIAAAASTQYVIDHWQPSLLFNLATCGGFAGEIEKGEIVLADTTIVYDIYEQMIDADAAINHFTTRLDLSWLEEPYPHPVKKTVLVSADRDLIGREIDGLKKKYGAVAGDWESGAIAYVAQRNRVPCLILRGVSDVVNEQGSAAYQNVQVFESEAGKVMDFLLEALPAWIQQCKQLL
jgi:adenosylhomocysteine nucleosidase